ncbi:MAG: type IV pilus modification protein PilV [Methylococcales bacterium]|nr:type IV pilus modification protein PilV [Methylococcales bacterium]
MKKNHGFTLIEVLISMVILAIGLLGLAGIQMMGLKNNLSSYQRGQATLLVYDMADRMRTNITHAELGSNSQYVMTNPLTQATKQNGCTTITGSCTPSQMAEHDLFEWNTDITRILPNGVGKIEIFGPLANRSFTISLTWDDKSKINDAYKTNDELEFKMSFKL